MKIFFLVFLFISIKGFGQENSTRTYIIQTKEKSSVYGCYSAPCSNELVFEGTTATATNSASTVYVPIYDEFLNLGYDPDTATTTIGSNLEFSLFVQLTPNSSTPTNNIPSYTQNSADPSAIVHTFTVQNSTPAEMYIYAALVNPSNRDELRIIGNNTTASYPNLGSIPRNSTMDFSVSLSIYSLCTTAGNSYIPTLCAGLKSSDPTDLGPHYPDVLVYYFLSPCKAIPENDSEDNDCKNPPPATINLYPGGIYFKYFLGNIVNTIPPTLDSVAKGDERVKVNFSGNGVFYLNDVIAVKYPDASSATEQNYFQALSDNGVLASSGNGPLTQGSIIVKNLVNNEPLKLGVAYVNKFKFATLISEGDEQTPQAIQTFIQEKECYLLSAGFQRDHFVLEYFRSFRDKILLKNYFGRMFVKWYYRTAPEYAQIIYGSAPLRFLIRSTGYLGYFVLKFFHLLLGSVFIYFVFRRFRAIRG